MALISVSIVSHGQGPMLPGLLTDLASHCRGHDLECLLTLNIPEALPFDPASLPFPVHVIRNDHPLGFGANHNQAFAASRGDYFCVMNPDIRLPADPFARLLDRLAEPAVALAAPLVLDPYGNIEDSARRFPSPFTILCKAFRRCQGSDYDMEQGLIHPEWVGGMFMLFRRDSFAALHGFDEGFFLYYEDVDLCARLRLAGQDIVLDPAVSIVHHAQRSSRSSMRYLRWHLASMARYFVHTYPRWLAFKGRKDTGSEVRCAR